MRRVDDGAGPIRAMIRSKRAAAAQKQQRGGPDALRQTCKGGGTQKRNSLGMRGLVAEERRRRAVLIGVLGLMKGSLAS